MEPEETLHSFFFQKILPTDPILNPTNMNTASNIITSLTSILILSLNVCLCFAISLHLVDFALK